jgi:hypothetical protein
LAWCMDYLLLLFLQEPKLHAVMLHHSFAVPAAFTCVVLTRVAGVLVVRVVS